MRFLILRLLTHSELGMFHEYRRGGKERSRQRAINFDGDVVDRVFPAAKDFDSIEMQLRYDTDGGVKPAMHRLKRQRKNWRLEGNCPTDRCYSFVKPGCLFAMEVDAGRSPAVGAWAVFASTSPVASKILSGGESGDLSGSAMIALHEEEGQRSWNVLQHARPDLFQLAPSQPLREPVMKPETSRKQIPPNPARLVNLLSAVGHTMPSAVADLVDNSISAGASQIEITFGRPDAGQGRWMTIADDGQGMNAEGLEEAMRLGSESNYDGNSLGKYGYGLKGASWSQARVFTVVTKQRGSIAHHLTWDVDDMSGWTAKSDSMEDWERDATALGQSGTVVLWKSMRVPKPHPGSKGLDPYSAEVMSLERHLALVFHRFLEGKAEGRNKVVIRINGAPVRPNNPVGHPLTSPYDAKTIRIPTEKQDGRVVVKPFLLPSEEEITEHHKAGGPEEIKRALDLIGLHGKRNETQGLFIYRHDRLIRWGGWHQMWETNDEKTKLARVIVDFDNVLDESFKINISKQIVHLPQQLQAEIKKLADQARKDSQRKYRRPPKAVAPSPATPDPPPAAGGKTGQGAGQPTAPQGGAGAPAVRVVVKDVKTDKFVWKVTKGMAGTLDIQVSDQDPNLSRLMQRIRDDAEAVSCLAVFLGQLDAFEVQSRLLSRKGE